ncbi:hypothetical protein MA03_06315 [Infirmifilum uzonense]|uniref:Uncharacterized protein n=1 Tax=Infirmifilum uzonense TaxID=1550241 RepID=A0A0F7FJ89_9CREN|nr:hypothetical protein [Infirmifilum uzonense]AKG38938.1 hypothetical protein MA03_06315 [Infirmifilum uzonense]
MSEEVGRSIMLIITLAVVSLIGFFIYQVASTTTSRPVLVQAGDAVLTSLGNTYSVILWLQNAGSSSADLTSATLVINNYNVSAPLTCSPAIIPSGATATCRASFASTSAITTAATGYIVTRYGVYKVVMVRS